MSRRLGGILIVLLLLLSAAAPAVDRIELAWARLEAPAWRAFDINAKLDWGTEPARLELSIARLETGGERLRDVRLVCTAFELASGAARCRTGRLAFRSAWLDAHDVRVGFDYGFSSGVLEASLAGLPLAGGSATLSLRHAADGWRLQTDFRDALLARAAPLASRAGLELPSWELAGRAAGRVTLRGGAAGLRDVAWNIDAQQAGYSNEVGSQAAEALALASEGRAVPEGGDWRVDASLAARGGMLYSDPLYLEFSDSQPLTAEASLRWRAAPAELRLDALTFDQPGVVRGRAEGVLAPGEARPLERLALVLEEAVLPGFYTTWLQPWLAGSVLERLDTGGRLKGRLAIRDGRAQSVRLDLERVSFGEGSGLFGMQALDGELAWDGEGPAHRARLAWTGAHFHQLLLGPAVLHLEIGPDGVRLLAPGAVGVLDGQLQVEEFELGLDPQGEPRWLLDATLTPVSMEAFSTALGWPPMAGALSGMIPRVRYEKGELTVGGTLLVRAFDGAVTVRNLRIREPLGLVPRLWADARLEALDLETLTRTFSFGRIEGRLQGEVKDLYMEAWQLVAFDAHFETPPDDDSRQRISQRAVDNISNLGGGGVGGVVSRGFLSLFEEFPYRRLGIKCRLEQGVCHMGGVEPAENGYYLVQGTWLPPRLDVIGYAKEVAWQSLVDRLVAVTRGEAPRIE